MIDAMQGGPATDAEEVPIWERREQEKKRREETNDLPFGLYLLFSSFTAIAAVRSSSPGDSRTGAHRSYLCMTTSQLHMMFTDILSAATGLQTTSSP